MIEILRLNQLIWHFNIYGWPIVALFTISMVAGRGTLEEKLMVTFYEIFQQTVVVSGKNLNERILQ